MRAHHSSTVSRRGAVAALGRLAAVGAAGTLAACAGTAGQGAGGESRSGASMPPATIEWYKYLNAAQAQQAPEFLAEFHAARPSTTAKLTIRPGGAAQYMEKLVALVVAGQPPDALQIHGTAYLAASLGLAQDLSDLYRLDKLDTGKFNQVLFQYGSQWQGKTLGLPFANQAEAVALIYNRNHLRAAGLSAPPERWNDPSWTWERFVEAARKAVKVGADGKTAVHGLNRLGSYMIVPQSLWGGTWVKDDYKTIVCDSQEVIDAYQAFVDLRLKHRVWLQEGESADFRQQQTAFSVLGAWELLEYSKLPPDVDWAFAPFPKGMARAKASPQAGFGDNKRTHVRAERRR